MSDLSRSGALSPEVLRWVEGAVGPGARVRAAWPLAGATSSELHALEVERGGHAVGLVLRRFLSEEWLSEEPELARHEAESLRLAGRAGVAVPELVAFDESGEHCGAPATLMTRLRGSVVLRPADLERWLYGLAAAVLPFRRVEAAAHPWAYFPYADLARLAPPEWSEARGLWAKAIEVVKGPRPLARECFIHRDYHPANVLWHEDGVSGVVDWVNACRGPAAFDAAWCRLNLAQLHGAEAAERFLDFYQQLSGEASADQPFWDLMALVEVLPGPPGVYEGWAAFGVRDLDPETVRARLEQHLARVLAKV